MAAHQGGVKADVDLMRAARNYVDHMSDLPLQDRFGMQLGRGPFSWRSLRASGRDSMFLRLVMDHAFTGYLVPKRGWTAVTAPAGWRGDYVFNGRIAERGDIFVVDAARGYSSRSVNVDSVGIGLRTDLLEATVAALAGRADDPSPLPVGRLSIPPASGVRFRRRLIACAAMARKRPEQSGLYSLWRTGEQELYEASAQVILEHHQYGANDGSVSSDLTIVRRALDNAQSSADIPSLADLCRAANVGQTRLFHSFVAIHGMPPKQFLRRMRMELAHESLTNREAPPNSVKDVALSLGFGHGGRFAAEYKAIYGSKPSETLQFARKEAGY